MSATHEQILTAPTFTLVKVLFNNEGRGRVLGWNEKLILPVDKFTNGVRGPVAHCRDYRYPETHFPYQIWSIGADGYEIVGK